MSPKKFGKYEVIEKIGQGGMGEVFKARDPLLKRDVAIKTISATVSADEDLRSRFEREAQLAAGLNHPNIVHIYDFGEESGQIYMAMELLVGKDLKAAIKKSSLATLDDKLALMEDVCEGLAFAHFREIVHRDLKPANIHIQPDGRAKIMDFGLAKLESSDMTRTGVILGTPDYMAPEQVQGGKADPRSDIYSLGAVFYELLAGRRPFQAESTHALLFQVLYNQPDPLGKLLPDLPLVVQGIVERAMSKDPAMRFQNGGEMRDAIRLARHGIRGEDSDATLVADLTLSPAGLRGAGATPRPGMPLTPRPGSGPHSGGPAGGPPMTPPSVAPGSPMPMSGGPSGYPHPMATGAGTPSHGSAGSMAPGSQGYGSFSQPTVVVQKSYGGLYVGLAVAAVAIAALVLYAMGMLPGFPKEDTGAAQRQVESLELQMLQRDLDAAQESFNQKSFDRALSQLERVLLRDAANAEAIGLRDRIQVIRSDLEKMTAGARGSLDGGDAAAAAATVARMLEIEPSYAPALGLSNELNEQLRGEAESARQEMAASRARAEQTEGASSLGSFVSAASVAGEAQALFDSGRFGQASAKFRTASQGFESARREAQRVAALRPAKPAPPPPRDPGPAETARRAMLASRTRAEGTEGAASLGSFVAAVALAREGESLFGMKEYDGAEAKFKAAADGYEAARGEAVRIASQKPVVPAPQPQPQSPVPVPQPQPASPRPPPDERPAIREVIGTYERVFETKDVELYRTIKPNLSPNEESALQRLFDRHRTYEVAIEIKSIDVTGSTATVGLLRQDTMDGKPAQRISQKVYLTRADSGRWVIERLGQ